MICAKRGGDTQVSDHSEWLLTVLKKPDAVDFSFIPITSLLKGAPGKGFLSHAINLYLRCKFILFSLLLKINENKTITAKHEDYMVPSHVCKPVKNMPNCQCSMSLDLYFFKILRIFFNF